MKALNTIFLIGTIILFACCGNNSSTNADNTTNGTGTKQPNAYAKLFEITQYSNCKAITVINPWDTTRILHKYVLVDKDSPLPDNLPQGTIIRTPVDNIIMYTTIHASIWEEMGALEDITGICEPEYLTSANVLKMISQGEIHDCGKAASPNVEKIMDIGGEIIIASPFEYGGYGQAEKLGIPIFESADYMENHPLGRVEWMKVFGLLSGRKDVADSLYNATCVRYNALKQLADNVEKRPRIMSERKYGSSWFIAGGASYMSKMYADAGGEYVFQEYNSTGSVPLSYENVYDEACDADIWLFKYGMDRDMTYNDLRAEYKPYEDFAPFKNKRIYTCNSVKTPYYEYIAIHPDYILADFLHIFHPQLMPDYEPVCYKPMAE